MLQIRTSLEKWDRDDWGHDPVKDRTAYVSDQILKRWGYPEQELSGQPPEKGPRPGGESLVFLVARSERKETRSFIKTDLRVRFLREGPPEAFEGVVLIQHRRGRRACLWRL